LASAAEMKPSSATLNKLRSIPCPWGHDYALIEHKFLLGGLYKSTESTLYYTVGIASINQ